MKFNYTWTHCKWTVVVLACAGLPQLAFADCAISEEVKLLDPVEAGFCASDAVFIGKVEIGMETVRAYTEEGSGVTKHFRIHRSTVLVHDRIKGTPSDKVMMIADLYAKDAAYVFETGKTYLIFAKHLATENEYAGASAACSVQPTLPIGAASKALSQLVEHKTGRKKIDCENIRPKEQK